MRFHTSVVLGGTTATGLVVPVEVDVPPDLAAALEAVLSVDGAKIEATRQRGIEKVLRALTPTG